MSRPPFIWLLPVLFLIQDGSNAEPVQSDLNTTNSKDSRLDKAKQADFSATDMPNMDEFPSRAPYYVYIKQKMTWFEARKACQKLGGDLATFPSHKAFDNIVAAIEPIFDDSGPEGLDGGIWVGASRQGETWEDLKRNHWKWVTGESFPRDFNKWNNGAWPDATNYKGAYITYNKYSKKGFLVAYFQSFPYLYSLCQIS